jgi:hypothetical protein
LLFGVVSLALVGETPVRPLFPRLTRLANLEAILASELCCEDRGGGMREEVEGRTEEDRLPAGDVAVDDARLEILLCPEPPAGGLITGWSLDADFFTPFIPANTPIFGPPTPFDPPTFADCSGFSNAVLSPCLPSRPRDFDLNEDTGWGCGGFFARFGEGSGFFLMWYSFTFVFF